MMYKINFVLINIGLPLIMNIIYLKNPKKNQINYEITKGMWYLIYAIVVAVDYLYDKQTQYVVGFTITLAIMEGVPLLLGRLFNVD